MDISVLGIGVAALSFCLGYGFRRKSLDWENKTKLAEQQMQLQTEQLQATVSASLDGIIVINLDGEVVDFSESAEKIFGHKCEDILGKNMADLIVPERYRGAHNAGMARMRNTGKTKILGQRIEIEAMRADGTEFMSELAISRSNSTNGDIFIAYIRDISDAKAAQQALVEAKEAAEMANEAKSRFLATMSHEIRTPFNAVLGILDILGETKLDQDQKSLVKTAESSSLALLRIINDVLDYARMSSGQTKLVESAFQANSVFDDVIQLFRAGAEEKGLAISTDKNQISKDLFLKGDLGRIRQILMNFVSNALKFTDEGNISLEVNTSKLEDGQHQLTCTVHDTGIGISGEAREKLFDEFFMADNSDSREFEGTGLGLTISKTLAELMGGKIGCDSEPGKGSSFWFSVPLHETNQRDIKSRYPESEFDMKNCRILVAEDNMTNQMVVSHVLESRCGKLVMVDNGEDVLTALENEEFDLILMDIFMPKMSGKDATRIIRASNNAHKNIPIIALTAMGSFNDLEGLRKIGVTEIVTKPFKKTDLIAAIGSVLDVNNQNLNSVDFELSDFFADMSSEELNMFKNQLRIDMTKMAAEIDDAIAQQKHVLALRPTHSLKGLAGTYGMKDLERLAEEAHQFIKDDDAENGFAKCTETQLLTQNYLSKLDDIFERAKDAA